MLRLLHMADVHLGARHLDLGEAAPRLRERQHAAFRAAVDLAIAERVGAVLIAGDLFDANTVSPRTLDQAVAELKRLAAERIRTVLLPGDHDAYTRSSIYRAHDLAALVGEDWLTVLTPEWAWVHLDSLDAIVVGPADAARPAAGFAHLGGARVPAVTWRIGLLHGAVGDGPWAVPQAVLEASGLDFAALGHDHQASTGRAGAVVWAVAGSPEQVTVEREAPGSVYLVTLDEQRGVKRAVVEPRPVGSTRHRAVEIDVGALATQAELVDPLMAAADPDVVLDVRLVGERADELELDPGGVEDALRARWLHARVDDRSRPPLTVGALPPPETIAGAFLRHVEGRIADLESSEDAESGAEAAELREVLRLGRRLLAGAEVAS
jgi:DNA repair exonuclease SbcCD nuclease subunit